MPCITSPDTDDGAATGGGAETGVGAATGGGAATGAGAAGIDEAGGAPCTDRLPAVAMSVPSTK